MPRNHPITLWLLFCCGMIFAMAVIGAITRLTESGLSITEWQPISGAIPPLNEADWQKAFEAYRQIPQYKLLNADMELASFKHIYFWEWLHRLWGRLIGLAYALPFFWFLWRRQIPVGMQGKLWLGLALGGLQAAVGWYMVASGLNNLVYVSHLRLALHLGLALVIYGYLFWLALGLMRNPCHVRAGGHPEPLVPTPVMVALDARLREHDRAGMRRDLRWLSIRRHGLLCLLLLATTILWGALTAGLKAGWAYNSFPLMDGAFLPEESWTLRPLWLNFFDNSALVQFCHRWLAVLTAAVIWLWCRRLWRAAAAPRPLIIALASMTGAQAALGIITLLTRAAIIPAVLHQAGAMIVLSLLLAALHRCRI